MRKRIISCLMALTMVLSMLSISVNAAPWDGTTFTNNATVKYYGDIVYVTGEAGTDYAGQDVTVVIVPKATYTDEYTFKYVGTCAVETDGTFTFKFKADTVDENDVFLINIGNTTVTASEIIAKPAAEELVAVSLSLDADNKVSLEVKNMFADIMDSKLIIATYDADKVLIDSKIIDYSLAFGEFGEIQTYLSDAAVEGSTVATYLWRDIKSMRPLSEADSTGIPAVEVSE